MALGVREHGAPSRHVLRRKADFLLRQSRGSRDLLTQNPETLLWQTQKTCFGKKNLLCDSAGQVLQSRFCIARTCRAGYFQNPCFAMQQSRFFKADSESGKTSSSRLFPGKTALQHRKTCLAKAGQSPALKTCFGSYSFSWPHCVTVC